MSKSSSKFNSKSSVKTAKGKNDNATDIDIDDDYEMGDFFPFPDENERQSKKLASRRKIDMYFEKKRLREKLDDLEDIDYDF
ncbi:MAG: PA3496 family putative envelope integrity protein [Gammaproteobacteria bacterium]